MHELIFVIGMIRDFSLPFFLNRGRERERKIVSRKMSIFVSEKENVKSGV